MLLTHLSKANLSSGPEDDWKTKGASQREEKVARWVRCLCRRVGCCDRMPTNGCTKGPWRGWQLLRRGRWAGAGWARRSRAFASPFAVSKSSLFHIVFSSCQLASTLVQLNQSLLAVPALFQLVRRGCRACS